MRAKFNSIFGIKTRFNHVWCFCFIIWIRHELKKKKKKVKLNQAPIDIFRVFKSN